MVAERAQERRMDSDYPIRMSRLANDIVSTLQQPHAKLQVGPIFHAVTSQQVPVHIQSLVIRYRDEDLCEDCKGYFLIAQDDTGEIVGHAFGDFSLGRTSPIGRALFGKENVTVMGSTVATAFRGEGFSVPLILAHRAFLQQEANNLGVSVTMVVADANSAALHEARRMVKEHPDNPQLQESLALKEAEHRRWDQLWVDGQHVRFTPRHHARRKVQASDVFLSRATNMRGIVAQVDREVEDTRSPQQKQAQFTHIMQAIDALAA